MAHRLRKKTERYFVMSNQEESKSVIVKEMISQQIYEDVSRRIRCGELKQGTRLVVGELCSQYNVSSTPVRDAITLLYRYGFAENLGNSRYAVITLTRKLVEDALEVFRFTTSLGIDISEAHDWEYTYGCLKRAADAFLSCEEQGTYRSMRLFADVVNVFVDYSGNDCYSRMVDPLLGVLAIGFGDYLQVFSHELCVEICRDLLTGYETHQKELAKQGLMKVFEAFSAYARENLY